jgi:hypothetical protein
MQLLESPIEVKGLRKHWQSVTPPTSLHAEGPSVSAASVTSWIAGRGAEIVRLAYQESDCLRRFGGLDVGTKFFRVAGITEYIEKNEIVGVRPPQRARFADIRSSTYAPNFRSTRARKSRRTSSLTTRRIRFVVAAGAKA